MSCISFGKDSLETALVLIKLTSELIECKEIIIENEILYKNIDYIRYRAELFYIHIFFTF